MQLKKKNIVILSMILLLFVIGYAYNMLSDKYITADENFAVDDPFFYIEDSDLSKNTEAVSVVEHGEDTASTEIKDSTVASESYNPFKEASNVAVVQNTDHNIAVSSASAAFFAEYRLERDKNRSREVEMWSDIINNQNSEQTFKELAQQELVKIVALTEREMMIENLIISRGFNDALVFLTDDSASVIVETKELTQAQVAQIQDIIVRKTKLDPMNIRIMTKN